ncbi:hypothetical protein AVEN_163026-1 [Araneus ventricosus]|uniref:Uncharacterized protein n=1 Tax=Araneus ventricosus TaxID=182803 RepID=A0A4Y2SLS6_ARAVE|nr:hypothetical protein AVEN_163026-1 [Araneus ventricosus]
MKNEEIKGALSLFSTTACFQENNRLAGDAVLPTAPFPNLHPIFGKSGQFGYLRTTPAGGRSTHYVTADPGGVGHYGPREAGPSGAGPYGPGGAGLSVPGGAGPYGPGEPGGAGPGTGSTGGEGLVRVDLEVSVGGTPGGGPDGSGPDVKKTSVIYLNLY